MALSENDINQIKQIVNKELTTNLYRLPRIPPHKHDGIDNINIPQTSVTQPMNAGGSITMSQSTTYTLFFPTAGVTRLNFNGVARNSGGSTAVTFNGPFAVGATGGVLTSTWGGSTASRSLTFSSGEIRSALFTNGSLTVSWTSTPLAKPATPLANIDQSTIKALVVGQAHLTSATYFQPLSNNSAVVGGPSYPSNRYGATIDGMYNVPMQCSSALMIDLSSIANTITRVSQFHIVYCTDSTGSILAQATVTAIHDDSIEVTTSLASGWSIIGNWDFS